MKLSSIFITFIFVATLSSCDVRSEIAKKNMEKYEATPNSSPYPVPSPQGSPIDPKDVVTADINQEGTSISFNMGDNKRSATCSKLDRVMVNGDNHKITIKGACRRITINGDGNEVTADAALEFTLNGSGNTLRYSRFVNGARPSIVENRTGNTIERISAPK